ncbi:MAG: DUF58 domain-containing protein [Acidobacteria bacterium]|nr:DUF58 domain-containing protein [Acidobacteriota bacterium]
MTKAGAAGYSTGLLDPAVVGAIEDLELAARLLVEGARSGQHRSPFHGFSNEFSQYRAYRPGDDLKYLDWKVLARTDRLYTRQFRETTNMSVVLVVDTSGSMHYPPPSRPSTRPEPGRGTRSGPSAGISKFRYAIIMAAALAHLIIKGGDAVGLMTMQGEKLVYVPARGGRGHLRVVLAQLAQLTPSAHWDPARVLTRAADLLRRRGVVLALSDFYDEEETTRVELRRVARRGHDVAVLQVVSRDEVDLPFSSNVEFEDLESGARVVVDARAARGSYREQMAAFLERWRIGARRDGLDYSLMTTDEPPSEALRAYLLKRGQPT